MLSPSLILEALGLDDGHCAQSHRDFITKLADHHCCMKQSSHTAPLLETS